MGQPAATLAQIFSNQRGAEALTVYPVIFDLVKDKGNPSTALRMATLISIPLQERPDLLIIMDVPPLHLQFLWVINKLFFSYANKTVLDEHIVAFLYDAVAGPTPLTITINPNC